VESEFISADPSGKKCKRSRKAAFLAVIDFGVGDYLYSLKNLVAQYFAAFSNHIDKDHDHSESEEAGSNEDLTEVLETQLEESEVEQTQASSQEPSVRVGDPPQHEELISSKEAEPQAERSAGAKSESSAVQAEAINEKIQRENEKRMKEILEIERIQRERVFTEWRRQKELLLELASEPSKRCSQRLEVEDIDEYPTRRHSFSRMRGAESRRDSMQNFSVAI